MTIEAFAFFVFLFLGLIFISPIIFSIALLSYIYLVITKKENKKDIDKSNDL
jgi:hypothetical protein